MKYLLLIPLTLFIGCTGPVSVEDGKSGENSAGGQSSVSQTNDQASSSGDAGPSEEEAIAALEALGANCTKDNNGRVMAVALDQKKITEDDLAHLKSFHHLKQLSLYGTSVTDAAIEHLKPLTTLELLNIEYTKITREGKASLRAALPDCQIYP